MTEREPMVVYDEEGRRGTIVDDPSEGATDDRIIVRTDRGRQIAVSKGTLRRQSDGTWILPWSFEAVEREAGRLIDQGHVIIPVISERLKVGTREVETGGVRLTKTVREDREVIDEPLVHDEVEVERVAVNRPIDAPEESRYEGDTLVIPVMEEVLHVEKRLVLREELRVTRRRVQERHPEEVSLRREEVHVERREGEN